MTGATAEKHDSFLDWSAAEQQFIAKFTGKRLIKGESDASSFPSGAPKLTAKISSLRIICRSLQVELVRHLKLVVTPFGIFHQPLLNMV